ncbi:MAG: TetR/AcrR family transcriptional regulator [Deltaproteobacteria bacterium]|nr:TetR/AcrR family transcriptional regulator [Deltaproteobacteria bacterium]
MTRTASRKTSAPSPSARGTTTATKRTTRRTANGAEEDGRKRLDLDERRDQLLALGKKLFGERAYDEISIDDIAEAAGISKGLLYHYFGSKRGFYVAIVRESADKLVEATEVGSELPPAERARAGLEGYLDFAEEHSAAFLTLLRGGIGNDPEVTELVDATRERILVRMLANMGQKNPRPVFRLAVRSYLGLVEAATIDWLDRKAVDRDTLLRFLLESVYAIVTAAVMLDPEAGVRLDEREVLEAQALARGKKA